MYRHLKQPLVWLLAVLMALPWPWRLDAQSAGSMFKPEEIEQLVAPIALYPDSLVSQILMASTYPLEVVQADRWVKANKSLQGEALTAALEKQPWDPSIKSLVNFPQVLAAMSEKLDVTQKLGDVFLAQQKEVLDAIQRLRVRAQAEGNLQSTKEQKVIVERVETQTTVIKIVPATPQVIYVPTYNPTVVYGAWPYPAYPPYTYYPAGYVATAAFAFTAGVALGVAWGYAWGGCNWRRGDVDIDINRNVNINRNINRERYRANVSVRGQGGRGAWQHDPSHRKGVAYRDQGTAQRYNRGRNAQATASREAFRGRAEQGRQNLQRNSIGDRGGVASRDGSGARQGQRGGSRGQVSNAGSGSRGREAAAFQGVGRGSEVRSASQRGATSRKSAGFSGASGGGGARRGGGGRRR